jgi:hypothetical protein
MKDIINQAKNLINCSLVNAKGWKKNEKNV